MPAFQGDDGKTYPFADDVTPDLMAAYFNKIGVRPVGLAGASPAAAPMASHGATPQPQAMTFTGNDQSQAVLAQKRAAGEQSLVEGKRAAAETLPWLAAAAGAQATPVGWAADLAGLARVARLGPAATNIIDLIVARAPGAALGGAGGSFAKSAAETATGLPEAPTTSVEVLRRAGGEALRQGGLELGGGLAAQGVQSAAAALGTAGKGGLEWLAAHSPTGRVIRATEKIDAETAAKAASIDAKSVTDLTDLERQAKFDISDVEGKRSAALDAIDQSLATKAQRAQADAAARKAAQAKLFGQQQADALAKVKAEDFRLAQERATQAAIEETQRTASEIADRIGPLWGPSAEAVGNRVIAEREKAVSDKIGTFYQALDHVAANAKEELPADAIGQIVQSVERARPKAPGTALDPFLQLQARAAEILKGAVDADTGTASLQSFIAARGNMSQELYALANSKDAQLASQAKKMIEAVLGDPSRGIIGPMDRLIERHLYREGGEDAVGLFKTAKNYTAAASSITDGSTYQTLLRNPGLMHRVIEPGDPGSVAVLERVLKDAGRPDLMPAVRRGLVEDLLTPTGAQTQMQALANFGDRFQRYGQAKDFLFRAPEDAAYADRLVELSDRMKGLTQKTKVQDISRLQTLQDTLDRITTKGADTLSGMEAKAAEAIKRIEDDHAAQKAATLQAASLKLSKVEAEAQGQRAYIEQRRADAMKNAEELRAARLTGVQSAYGQSSGMARIGRVALGGLAGGAIGHGPTSAVIGASAAVAGEAAFQRLVPTILRIADDPIATRAFRASMDRLEGAKPDWLPMLLRSIVVASKAPAVYRMMRSH